MKKILLLNIILGIFLLFFFNTTTAQAYQEGYIYLQVEQNGEAWYIYPKDSKRYYLGRPQDAFRIMQKLSLGARHNFIANTEYFPPNLAGMILLDVESHGEAYYIYPQDLKKYYLGRPQDAFQIMNDLGAGITDNDLSLIPTGDISQDQEQQNKKIIPNVPFTPQAPFGDWSDQRQQDGCEEASALMAVSWARNKNFTPEEAEAEIINSSDYIQDKYGEHRDVSLPDVINWIIKDYFDYHQVYLKKDITIQDIISELNQDHLVLTPMDGQLMDNPYFTPPGPEHHMLVIRGYDPEREVFITNDPGTRHGELFEYDYNIFYNAIRNYLTGYYEPIESIKKDAIVIYK